MPLKALVMAFMHMSYQLNISRLTEHLSALQIEKECKLWSGNRLRERTREI